MPTKTKKAPQKKALPVKVSKPAVKKTTRRKKIGKRGNQYALDPRQDLYLANFLDPHSPTFSNALQSALKAGYAPQYAKTITTRMPEWMQEKVGDSYLLSIAEDNLKNMLEMVTKAPVISMVGPVKDEKGKVLLKENPNLLRIKADLTKFVVERLNKKKWSPRSELSGPGGSPLIDLKKDPKALETLLKVALTVGDRLQAAHDDHKKSKS